ncbi:hypothetical protein T439DRAFT_351746 [Meredithblackwellia eburnea MCA 4105]
MTQGSWELAQVKENGTDQQLVKHSTTKTHVTLHRPTRTTPQCGPVWFFAYFFFLSPRSSRLTTPPSSSTTPKETHLSLFDQLWRRRGGGGPGSVSGSSSDGVRDVRRPEPACPRRRPRASDAEVARLKKKVAEPLTFLNSLMQSRLAQVEGPGRVPLTPMSGLVATPMPTLPRDPDEVEEENDVDVEDDERGRERRRSGDGDEDDEMDAEGEEDDDYPVNLPQQSQGQGRGPSDEDALLGRYGVTAQDPNEMLRRDLHQVTTFINDQCQHRHKENFGNSTKFNKHVANEAEKEKFPQQADDKDSHGNSLLTDAEKEERLALDQREQKLKEELKALQKDKKNPGLIERESTWWQDVKTKVEKDEKDEGDESLIGSSSAEPSAAARLTDPGPQGQVPHPGSTTQPTRYSTTVGNQSFSSSPAVLENSSQQHNTHGEGLTDSVDWHEPTPQLPYHYMPHGFHYNPRTRRAEMLTDDGTIKLTRNNSDGYWWATEDSVPALRKKSARWIAERGIFISRNSSYHHLGPVATINDLARYKAVRWRHHSRMLNIPRNLA